MNIKEGVKFGTSGQKLIATILIRIENYLLLN